MSDTVADGIGCLLIEANFAFAQGRLGRPAQCFPHLQRRRSLRFRLERSAGGTMRGTPEIGTPAANVGKLALNAAWRLWGGAK